MINFKPFFTVLDNDAESINIVLGTYLEEYGDAHIQFKGLFDSQNWPELYLLAHSLKGILVNFGKQDIILVLEQIEAQTCKGEAVEKILVDKASVILPVIKKQVEQALLNIA